LKVGKAAMELRHLRYFIAVAEEGSLTLAAEKRLHTAQPSLSRQIRDLEYEVGVPLLNRSVHGIELTAAGRAFLDHARLALTQAAAAADAARRAAQPAKPIFAMGFLIGLEKGLAAARHQRPAGRMAQYRNQGFEQPLDSAGRRPRAGQA
jgi:DNA-binding transcriptional LysR family regulator